MGFRALYDAHFNFVWRSLRRLGVAEASLNDAVQDVFLVVYRRHAEFGGRSKLTTWLFRICLRIARDHRRRAHVRREVLDESSALRSEDPGADLQARAERREALQLFYAALEQLDFEQRAVFVLFELENMTGDAISETLEIPLGTVYSRLRLARRAFKRAVVQASLSGARSAGARGVR